MKGIGVNSDVKISEFHSSQFDELLSFLRRLEPNHPELHDGKILQWQKCHKFVALHNGKIVGYIGQIPHDFRYGELSYRLGLEHIGWGVTLVLDLSDNGIRKKAGRLLLARCENNPPLMFAGVGVIPTIESVYRRRGHVIRRDCCKLYGCFRNPERALAYLSKPVFWGRLIKVANFVFRIKSLLKKDLTNRVKWIDRFEPAWDDTWERILYHRYALYGTRNAEYLNYKLSQPNREYYVFYHTGGGYIILRTAIHPTRNLNLVKICDLVGSDHIRRQLLGLAMQYFHHSDVDGIVALSSVKDRRLYRSVGMYIAKAYPVCLHKSIKAKIHVSFFDSDLDNLW